MKKATLDKYVADHIQAIADPDNSADLERQIRLLIKDVDRDTRHAAAELAVKLHSEIMNLGH